MATAQPCMMSSRMQSGRVQHPHHKSNLINPTGNNIVIVMTRSTASTQTLESIEFVEEEVVYFAGKSNTYYLTFLSPLKTVPRRLPVARLVTALPRLDQCHAALTGSQSRFRNVSCTVPCLQARAHCFRFAHIRTASCRRTQK